MCVCVCGGGVGMCVCVCVYRCERVCEVVVKGRKPGRVPVYVGE